MEIFVTTFENPHLFWFFEKGNLKKREAIEHALDAENLTVTENVQVGEFVAVHNRCWKRAIIKSIDHTYVCWLIDYGCEYKAKNVFKISKEIASKTPLAKQGALINVVCLEVEYSVMGRNYLDQIDFTVGCVKRARDYLDSAKQILFSCDKEVNNVHLGDITIISATGTFNLAKMLIEDKILIENKELFQSAFPKNSKISFQLGSLICSCHLQKYESLEDYNCNGIGRGVTRISQTNSVQRTAKKSNTIEEWVQLSALSVKDEASKFDSDEEFIDIEADDSSSSTSQNFNNSNSLCLKDLKQAFAKVEEVSESYDDFADVLHEKRIKNKSKPSQVDWASIRSDKISHLNIPPSGMLIPKPKKNRQNNSMERSRPSTADEKLAPSRGNTVSSDSESNTNRKENALNIHKPLILGCTCEQCVGWEGEDLYFNENKKNFEDKCTKKAKEIVKPMLLLKEGDRQPVKIKSCIMLPQNKIKLTNAANLLVHGSTFLSPVMSLSSVPFHADIHKALRTFEQVYSLQSYAWPAVMRHMNICIVGQRNSGKTMCYLPGVCSFELERNERYPDLPQNTISPLTVILCPGVESAEKVFNTILKLLEHSSIKTYVALAIQPIDKKCLNQFQKLVHILVATPKTLTSLLATRIITLKRLCHFVIEDADVILQRFSTEIDTLMELTQSMLMHRSCNYTVQMIITAQQWTLSIEKLLKSLLIVPVVCIGSYLEAALYGRVDLQLHFVESNKKKSTLGHFLKGKSDVCRTIVICKTNEEINEVKDFLLYAGINCLFITDLQEPREISEIESRWLHSPPGKYFALICTDNVFNISIKISNAILLVHYSLPDTWTQFTDRFRSLVDNYISPLTDNISDDWTRCKAHIFIDEFCNKQFQRIVEVMERLGANLPSDFQAHYEENIRNNEQEKIAGKVRMCNNLRLFGKCSITHCKKRHFVSKDLDYFGHLPKNGLVKYKIKHVHSVSSFAVQLLDHTDVDGKTSKYDVNENLDEELNKAMNEEKNLVFDAKPGGRYVYHSNSDQKYYRCSVRKIVATEKITKKANTVSIRCLDTGLELETSCSYLYELPACFGKFHPQVVDVFLANMVPPDLDDTWSFYAKKKVVQILQEAGCASKEVYSTGQIQLQLGNALWLKNIMVYEVLRSTDLTVNKLNLRKKLLDENLAVLNEAQLKGLYKSCNDAAIELPNYDMSEKDVETSATKQIKPQWSYFDESESIEIYITYVESPSIFYVRLKKFYNLFLDLQKEIQRNIAKPFYPSITDVCIGNCYLAKDPEGDEYARVIVKDIVGDNVTVFFVDFGDYAIVEKTELKYLPNEIISKLPFQVIECRLYGVEPVDEQWTLSGIHQFVDFVFEPNTDYFRTLYTTSCKQELSSSTGGMKYSVLVVDNFDENIVIVNKLLIDIGEASAIKDEDINIQFSLPSQVDEDQFDVISDIEDNEMTVEEIKLLQEKHGAKPEVIKDTDSNGEPSWDIQINDAELFIKKLINADKNVPSTSRRSNWELPPLQALPPSDHCTPNIFWHQTNKEIRINIMLSNITDCDLKVARGKLLIFSATYSGKQYKLNLNFFDNVEKKFQYTLGGPHIKVTLKKTTEAEWPRLIISTSKMRFIKYDINHCDYEDEKKKRFLDLGLDEDEDVCDGVIHDIGSDDNYSESDYESDFED